MEPGYGLSTRNIATGHWERAEVSEASFCSATQGPPTRGDSTATECFRTAHTTRRSGIVPPHARLFRRDLVVDGVCIKAAVDIITFRVPVRPNQPACSRPVVQHRSAQKCAVKKGNLVEEPGEGLGPVVVVEGGLEEVARIVCFDSSPRQGSSRIV